MTESRIGTAVIKATSKISRDKKDAKDYLQFVPPGSMSKWAKTQESEIEKQLKRGARHIDLRVCNGNGSFYTCHGLRGEKLNDALRSIASFSRSNRDEVAIVDVAAFHLSGNKKKAAQEHKKIADMIVKEFGKDRMNPEAGSLPTCNEIRAGRPRLIVLHSAIDAIDGHDDESQFRDGDLWLHDNHGSAGR